MASALAEKPNAETLPRESGAASLLNGHYAPPPEDKDGKTWVRTSAIVQAEAQALYELWRNLEAAPAWQERVTEVRATGPNTYHWTMRDEPGDKTLEWDSEILAEEPGKRIVWRTFNGDRDSAGEVIFEPAPGGRGTMITVLEQFHAGKLARLVETITGRDPKQSVIEDVRHFKALAETGEIPRIEPQPHGERGVIGGMKRSTYGEKIETPTGTLSTQESASGTEGSSR